MHGAREVIAAWPVRSAPIVTRTIMAMVTATLAAIDVAGCPDTRLGDAVHHVLAMVPTPVMEAGDATADAEHGTCGEDEREKDSHGGFLRWRGLAIGTEGDAATAGQEVGQASALDGVEHAVHSVEGALHGGLSAFEGFALPVTLRTY